MRASIRVSRAVGLLSLLVLLALLLAVPAAAAAPNVRIVEPANGATVPGPDVTIKIEATDVTLIPGAQATKPDQLHVHYLLDVDPARYLDGTLDLPVGDPLIVHTADSAFTFAGLAPGPHRVTVILTHPDHKAVQPPVAPAVSFTVGAPATPGAPPRTGGGGAAPRPPLLAGLAGLALLGGGLVGLALRRRAERL